MADIEVEETTQEDIDLIAQLKEQETPLKDIVRQVLQQNYNFPVKILATELGLSTLEIGQVKGTLKREQLARQSRAQKAEGERDGTPKLPDPPVVKEVETPPSGKELGLTPAAREFASALDQVLEKVTNKWKTFLVSLYEKQPPLIRQNRGQLENFLYRHGLSASQVAGVVDLVMPMVTPDYTGSQGMMAINPQTGQSMPIIIMGQGGQQGSPQGGPYIINPPPQNQEPPMSRSEIALTIRDTIAQELAHLETSRPDPAPQPIQPHIPYRRIPIMDEGGNIMKDASGQVVYQEVPYDPSMTMLEFLKPLIVQRPAPVKEVDEEKLLLKTREAFREEINKGGEGKKDSIDVEKLIMQLTQSIESKLGPRLQSLEAESAARDRHQEITQAVRDATTPLIATVQQLQSNQGFTLEERKVRQLTDTVTNTAKDVRSDLKTFVSQALIPTYAQMEKQLNLEPGTLVGPLMEQIKKETPLPTAGDANRILGTVEGWSKS